MAPSRRKGAKKAAAAEAARRQWKVGDLVLAKVKGFPAWPATVSEPEKWGYSADSKKVLVFFFGTQQIAFCNPVDVEAFTEEKKESLLGKRHGKGADFVRAVHEIIDSYEKMKKQEQVDHDNSCDEVIMTNASKSAESLTDSGLKDETPAVIVKSCPKMSRAKKDPSFSVESAAAATREDAMYDAGMPLEEPTNNFMSTETPLPTAYTLSSSLEPVQPKKTVTQKRAPSARRSRSSARVDASRLQNFLLPSSHNGKFDGDTAAYSLHDGNVTKNKRIRKPVVSEGSDSDSPTFMSNGSSEENGSEIVTADSDTLSFNEGSTVESGCKLLQQSGVDSSEGDVELNQKIDLAAVVKKKRKSNRKRACNDANELTLNLDKEAGSEIKVHKAGQISPSENLNIGFSKEDGDEHLPLVKRARVRMGRSSYAGEELDTLVSIGEKCLEVSNSISGQGCVSLNCAEDGPVNNSSSVKEGADNSSPSNKCPVNKPQPWELKKSQLLGCSVDGEAALPPSKRLHRALEAMSANAAEDGQTSSEVPSTMKTNINGCGFSSLGDNTNVSVEGKVGSESGVQNVHSFGSSASPDDTTEFSTSLNPSVVEESIKSSAEVAACNKPISSNNSPKPDACKDTVVPVDYNECKDLSVTSLGAHTAASDVLQSPKALPNHGGKQACLECNQGSLLSNDDCKTQHSEFSKPYKELDPLEISRMSSNPLAGDIEIPISSESNDTNLLLHTAEGKCSETTQLRKLQSDENRSDNGMSEVLKETKSILKDSSTTQSPTPAKVMMAAVQGTNLSHSASISEDHLSDKAIPCIRSTSSPTGGIDSTAHASPTKISMYNMPTSDHSNSLENNGFCTPEVHLHHEKPKHAGKWSNRSEANAALASFEATLGTLRRTKESIGRATRIAIDCAKFGSAAKVVDILVRSLESESSLHRRVDLFFLVDSITQCSRGFKGGVCDIYPSAIQVVLPRLLVAAAPPGSSSQENRRQCLKVLRVWQERRILPESIIHRHIRELDSLSCSSSTSAFSRRPLRTERPFDDPIRQMEGMLVDEYGSNSSFQLHDFRMPPMVKDEDEGSDSDGEGFEAVTPEHNSENPEKQERTLVSVVEKHSHIMEDIDGELEMEDVAPSCEAQMSSASNVPGVNTSQTAHHQIEQHFPPLFAPPLPMDVPPSCPPLPTSPPPPPPPLPPSIPPLAMPDSITNGHDSNLYMGAHNIKDDLRNPIAQHPFAPRINTTISEGVQYHAPEGRDLQHMQRQVPDSVNSCSFSCVPVPHPQMQVGNVVLQSDGAALDNKSFHLRPPQPALSNQFSYIHPDHRMPAPREIPPPSYPNIYNFVQNTDGVKFYSDHDRMKLAPHDIGESWRFSTPFVSGPCYHDSSSMSYGPRPYTEPAIANHGWAFPPQPLHHREPMPHRTPPSEGPVPVAARAPNFWRPR